MKDEKEITKIMLGMFYEKAKKIYSENLVNHGISPRNYGVITNPDGYGKITGT